MPKVFITTILPGIIRPLCSHATKLRSILSILSTTFELYDISLLHENVIPQILIFSTVVNSKTFCPESILTFAGIKLPFVFRLSISDFVSFNLIPDYDENLLYSWKIPFIDSSSFNTTAPTSSA